MKNIEKIAKLRNMEDTKTQRSRKNFSKTEKVRDSSVKQEHSMTFKNVMNGDERVLGN